MAKGGTRITVEELIRRATSGLKFNRRLLFRPSLVYSVLKDPFWVWCEYHAPKEEAVDETSRYDELRLQQGIAFEQEWVRKNYPEAVKIVPEFGFEALRNTCQAMVQGARAIYQPQLWDLGRGSYGKGDLLIRDDGSGSDLGPFHYRVTEIKRSKSLEDYHILQPAFYNRMLGLLQGHTPNEFTVILKEKSETVPYAGEEKNLEVVLSTWKALRDGDKPPEPGRPPQAASSPWRIYGNKRVDAERDLVLLAGVQKREREKLRKAGIHHIDQLWDLSLEAICEIVGESYGAAIYYVAQAYRTGGPILKPRCQLTIPRARRLLYFDFETSDQVHPTEPPHVYLIGCWDATRDQYIKFLARGAQDEGRIFEEFLDYAGDLENTRLYHWTDFEIGQMRNVIRRWPGLEGPLARLISCSVDLKQAIQASVYLPVPSFSLKCVAPMLGFRWRQQAVGAFESMVYYWDYLDGGDAVAINKAVVYNEDDCVAMWHVDQELTKRLSRVKE